MRGWAGRLRTALLAACLLLLGAALGPLTGAGPALAQEGLFEPTPAEQIETWDRAASAVERDLEERDVGGDGLRVLQGAMESQRAQARALAEELRAELEPLDAQAAALGPPPEDPLAETEETRELRARLVEERARVDGRLKAAELAAARAETLVQRMIAQQRRIFTERLFGQGPSLFASDTWARAGASALESLAAGGDVARQVALSAVRSTQAGLLAFGLIGLVALWALGAPRSRQMVALLIARAKASPSPGWTMMYAVGLVVLRAAPPTLTAYALAGLLEASGGLHEGASVLVWGAADTVLWLALAYALARILFAPEAPEQRIMPLDDAQALQGVRTALALAAVSGGGHWLFLAADASAARTELLAVLTAVTALLAGPIVWRLTRCVAPASAGSAVAAASASDGDDASEEEDFDLRRSLAAIGRFAGSCLALAIPASAVFGYYALSQFMLERGALTAALLAALGMAFVAALRLIYRHHGPMAPAEEEGDAAMSPPPPTPAPAAGLSISLVGFGLALLAAPALSYVWGASIDELRLMAQTLLEGVRVGEVEFSFAVALQAIAVVVVGLWITRVLQRILRRNVLPSTKLDKGAQTSVAAALGYLGFGLTVALAISTTGLDLSNLAIVAGALSVGIGFGLQNVVNNFVSGLILLVERPIQVGDWIIVGEAQGYVRRINVRSTEIETFDRASVIVPNSDLISNQVTNWTHKNLTGRVICRVGVSYGSDVDLVTQELKAVAAGHQMALRYPAPAVLFRGFGDSSLDFELRVFIRDVNWVLFVQSDMNFEILRRFRAAGIEIPFPQRDLHLISTPQAAAANGADVAPATPAPSVSRTADIAKDDGGVVVGEADGGGGDSGR